MLRRTNLDEVVLAEKVQVAAVLVETVKGILSATFYKSVVGHFSK